MTSRILPRDEYPRLAGTELEAVWPHLADDAVVLVVEDAGQIVGCWSAFRCLHVEGVWVAPEHRGKASVARRLLAGMRGVVRSFDAPGAFTAAQTDDVRGILDRLGAQKLDGDHYVVSFGGTERCQQQ